MLMPSHRHFALSAVVFPLYILRIVMDCRYITVKLFIGCTLPNRDCVSNKKPILQLTKVQGPVVSSVAGLSHSCGEKNVSDLERLN